MKNIGPIIVIAILLMGALVVFMLWGPMAQRPGLQQVENLPGVTAPPAKGSGASRAASSAGRGEPAGSPSGVAGAQSAEPGATANVSMPAPSQTVAAASLPFPSASDITMGLEKPALTLRYGAPSMVTTAVDQGRLIETYIYLRRDPNTATVVLLRGNRVIGATTTVY